MPDGLRYATANRGRRPTPADSPAKERKDGLVFTVDDEPTQIGGLTSGRHQLISKVDTGHVMHETLQTMVQSGLLLRRIQFKDVPKGNAALMYDVC